ncbi:MAG TPA: hypothetical protein VNT23_08370 [Gaiellaceae bacterium]|nr:hypothetical protein [Gaiellaceae bacterium]
MVLDPQPPRQEQRGARRSNPVIGRLTQETKQAFKTTEFAAYVLAVAGVLLASMMIDGGAGEDGGDYFLADDAWRLVTFLTIGYMISRGLAKAGSRDPYWARRDDLPGDDD